MKSEYKLVYTASGFRIGCLIGSIFILDWVWGEGGMLQHHIEMLVITKTVSVHRPKIITLYKQDIRRVGRERFWEIFYCFLNNYFF